MIDLSRYGYQDIEQYADNRIPGRVTELHRGRYKVVCSYGETPATLKGAYYLKTSEESFPCVGDFVLVEHSNNNDFRIVRTLPRHSMFSRADYSGHKSGYAKAVLEQVVAANFDFVFIVSSLNRDFNINRISRYLTQALRSGAQPVVVLTKADLVDHFNEQVSEVKYSAPGVPVCAVSSNTKYGFDSLEEYLQPRKTIVFLGMSGVGKSTLLNTLMNQNVMAVSSIREDDSRGRHTTTHRQLFMLPSGAMVIDTPGMRELGLYDAKEAISVSFNDVEELIAQCHFSDCHHETEPGCAVLAALKDGTLSHDRWERYLAQRQENEFVQDRSEYLTRKR